MYLVVSFDYYDSLFVSIDIGRSSLGSWLKALWYNSSVCIKILYEIIVLCFLCQVLFCMSFVTFQDGVANDIPRETFEVRGYPTVYFRSASGKISQYDGNRTKEDIIEFIEKNQDKPAQQGKDELEKG